MSNRKYRKTKTQIQPFHAVIFGGDGDLAIRKIYPAICRRYLDGQLNVDFKVFAITRSDKKHANFFPTVKQFIKDSIKFQVDETKIDAFLEKMLLTVVPGDNDEGYLQLKVQLDANKDYQTLFYLSTPSNAFGPICESLKNHGLVNQLSKVVLEKPLGNSLASSQSINDSITQVFTEDQIYRIDHYLGKETVQNLMVLRFANHLFENAWNSNHVESVQITVAESLGVEERGDYYDQSGALLDMVQNHLMQLLCLIAMEPPVRMEANFVRDEKLKVIHALRLLDENTVKTHTARGQYTRGEKDGVSINSYLEDIDKFSSNTETFVAIKAFVDNWRWKGVPFFLRTGKRMPKRYSEIIINFKPVAYNVFNGNEEIPGNKLIIRLQPEERIELVQMSKLPGPGGYRYKPVALKLDFSDSFNEKFPEAYERLFIDMLRGNQTLFMRQDELEAAWIWVESITNNWKKTNQKNILYEAGTWGPGDLVMDGNEKWSKTSIYEIVSVPKQK
ncbi:MAG: glucose-6-phosphate dehydrogenase [Crocinitomicaceae bacterium]|nr:glucose-6-phosphate dehydrogenase [Crocinitomicaceae bacterium]